MNRGGTNYALYERAENALEPAPVSNNPLTHRGLRMVLRNAAVALNYGLALPPVPGVSLVFVTRMPGGSAATMPRRVGRVRRPRP